MSKRADRDKAVEANKMSFTVPQPDAAHLIRLLEDDLGASKNPDHLLYYVPLLALLRAQFKEQKL